MKQILSIGLLAWSTAHAIELGSVSLTSVSGEPLRAQIPILLGQHESLEQLSAAILETKPVIPDLTLVLADGASPRINLSTKNPITVEKLALTLQVSQPDEDNEYHYEITFAPAGAKPVTQNGKPFVYGPVKSGETLWQVATVFAKHYQLTPDQAMASLYEHNKKAFSHGSQHQLMAGSYLKLPATIGKALTPKHVAVKFKPTEVITQTHPATPEPALAGSDTFVGPVSLPDTAAATTTVIPTFPSMEEGKQVAMNFSAALPGVPALKLLNPLTDANAALFSNTLNTVLGAEDTAFVKLLDTMQQELKMAREAIDLERQSKQALQSQVSDLQVQIRALTELVSLQQIEKQGGSTASIPFLLSGVGNSPLTLLMAAIVMASVLMYAWEHFMGPKTQVAPATPAPRPISAKASTVKSRGKLPSLAEVDQCMQQGRYYQAQEMLGTMLTRRPSDFDALYKLCQVYVKLDNRTDYESRLDQISPRWRMMYPERFERLQGLYEQAWSSSMSVHDDSPPVYEGDPPSDPVQTKLDLARAYIDIGDQGSAYEILAEVVKEGTPAQVGSAKVLMGQIKP